LCGLREITCRFYLRETDTKEYFDNFENKKKKLKYKKKKLIKAPSWNLIYPMPFE
jgi:hypothetical protein